MFLGCDVEQSVWSIVGAKDKIPEVEKISCFFFVFDENALALILKQ